MRSLRLLDLIITILFYSMLGIGIITFGVFILFLFGIDLGIKTSTTFSDKSKVTMYLLLFSIFIFYSSYVYSIYLFKQNISSFINFKLFTNQVIKNKRVYILFNFWQKLLGLLQTCCRRFFRGQYSFM